jgi:hypothetical protein
MALTASSGPVAYGAYQTACNAGFALCLSTAVPVAGQFKLPNCTRAECQAVLGFSSVLLPPLPAALRSKGLVWLHVCLFY